MEVPARGSCTWGAQALSLGLCLLRSEGGCSDKARLQLREVGGLGGGSRDTGTLGSRGTPPSCLLPSLLEKRFPMPGPPVWGAG